MISTRKTPRLRVNAAAASEPGVRQSPSSFPTSMSTRSPSRNGPRSASISPQVQEMDMSYPHVSVCRSLHMEVQIASPSVKIVRHEFQTCRSLPVFNESDRIGGQIILDPSCSQSGRLSVSIEGAFQYTSPQTEKANGSTFSENPGKRKHIFYNATTVIPVSAADANSRTSAFFREAFSGNIRKRAGSITSLRNFNEDAPPKEGPSRCFPFTFDLPLGHQSGQELPPTFSTSTLISSGARGRAFAEKAEVNYKVTAVWEPSDGYENRALLEVPIMFQPDNGFQSLDGTVKQPEYWLEMPLNSDRAIPFQCAITIPSPGNFARSATVPYYVVFTTFPRSSSLAKEIAADATISVALVRQVTISTAPPSLPPSPPLTPCSSAEDSDSSTSRRMVLSRRRLFSRVTKSAPTVLLKSSAITEEITSSDDKPLPDIPPSDSDAFSESRTLQTDFCMGFPKRPRNRGARHHTKDHDTSLPDGLYKGHLELNKDMLPGVDWPGVSIRYHLYASVIFRQNRTSIRIPIQIT